MLPELRRISHTQSLKVSLRPAAQVKHVWFRRIAVTLQLLICLILLHSPDAVQVVSGLTEQLSSRVLVSLGLLAHQMIVVCTTVAC